MSWLAFDLLLSDLFGVWLICLGLDSAAWFLIGVYGFAYWMLLLQLLLVVNCCDIVVFVLAFIVIWVWLVCRLVWWWVCWVCCFVCCGFDLFALLLFGFVLLVGYFRLIASLFDFVWLFYFAYFLWVLHLLLNLFVLCCCFCLCLVILVWFDCLFTLGLPCYFIFSCF